jgi:tRNA-specific 2-thiouridylase
VTYDKKDSTGICFIGERNFREFLGQYLPTRPGPMRTPDGDIVGEHQGLMFYTFGQRQGLGIGGRRDDGGDPWYVVDKDIAGNTLIVAQGKDHPLLYRGQLQASRLHWIHARPDAVPFRCFAKTRYRQSDQACTITLLQQDRCEVVFDQPQRAITPGQSVVFYRADECLGGGIIEASSAIYPPNGVISHYASNRP